MISENQPAYRGLLHYLELLWRGKWLILEVLILLPATAYYLESKRPTYYSASARVLLAQQNLSDALAGIDDPAAWSPGRTARTQAGVAQTPALAERVLARVGLRDRAPVDVLGATSVSAIEQADMLEFVVTDGDPKLAARLATAYAREYISYRSELETLGLRRARESLDEQMSVIHDRREQFPGLYRLLEAKRGQIRVAEALRSPNAFLVRPATSAGQVAPRPLQTAASALPLALVLSFGLAFVCQGLSTRLRRPEEIASLLDAPLLSRLPDAPVGFRAGKVPLLLDGPAEARAEVLRRLRLDVGFATAASHANCVLITSPVERESKSTMLAEFAMVLARDGHDVIIVDLDMRRPTQHACFDISQRPGLYDVLTNNVSLDNALRYVPLRTRISSHGGNGNTSENERSHMETAIRVLPAGTRGPAPGDLVGSDAMRRLLGRLREQCEFVLIDAPPLLLASDAAAISRSIDAIIVVARVGSLRRPMIANLRWALDSCAADKLGVVVTGADPELRKSSSFSRFIQPQPS